MRKNLVLFGIFSVLLILTALQYFYLDDKSREEEKLFSFLTKDVHTVKVLGEESYSLVKKGGGWHSETHDFPANEDEIQDLLETLSDTKREGTIENVSNKEPFGLGEGVSRSIEIMGENIRLHLRVGRTNPSDSYYYTDFGPAENTVYLVDKWDTDRIFKSWKDIRQKKLLYEYDVSSLDSLTYSLTNRIVMSVKKSATGGFNVIIPSGKVLNKEKWDEFIENVFDFEIDETREESISPEAEGALKKDAGYLLEFRFDGGSEEYLGVSVDKKDNDKILIFSSFLRGLGERTAYWKSDIEFDPDELFEEPEDDDDDEDEEEEDESDDEEETTDV